MQKFSGMKYIQANETTIKYCGHLLHKAPMKGGHRHRRNYWFCPMCGKAIKAGKFQAKNNIAMVHKTVRHMETVHQMPF